MKKNFVLPDAREGFSTIKFVNCEEETV